MTNPDSMKKKSTASWPWCSGLVADTGRNELQTWKASTAMAAVPRSPSSTS